MTTLADYLNANGVSSDTIVQAAWNLAFATVGFPSEEDIPDLFRKLLPHPDEIATDIETLTRDPRLMLAAALEVLSLGWDRDQATVISHIEECQAALVSFPKIATVGGVLVVAGWVLLSKGVTHHETHTMIRPDGGYEQIEKTDRGPFGLKSEPPARNSRSSSGAWAANPNQRKRRKPRAMRVRRRLAAVNCRNLRRSQRSMWPNQRESRSRLRRCQLQMSVHRRPLELRRKGGGHRSLHKRQLLFVSRH